jgi:netrin-G3 ligand
MFILLFQAVFSDLEEHTDYVLQVRAHTGQGAGPYSERITLHTERDIVRAPMAVKAIATSDSSVEVWWEAVPSRGKVIGYQVCYLFRGVNLKV